MSMRKLMILIMLFMTGSQLVYSQDYRKEADKCLVDGDYKCVLRNLRLYQEETGTDVSEQLQDVETCMKARTLAEYLFEEKDYEKAAQQYGRMLKLNPKDVQAKKQYDLCVKQSATFAELIYVKGGTFTMGCTSEQGDDCNNREKPTHRVTVSDFYIGKYEVTQAQWKSVMGSNPSRFTGDNLPVEQVSWNDVQEFIRKLNAQTGKNYRLPTEAEWEYAARGGAQSRGYKYSGSNTVGDVAWYGDNSGKATHPVGQKLPNGLGLYDMSGNVEEWCSDRYGDYSSSSQTNPAGPSSGSSGSRRVVRGGSLEGGVHVWHRDGGGPGLRDYSLGFRLASDSK
jgi:formylglycine-generating enzyme required for sulfatase activity